MNGFLPPEAYLPHRAPMCLITRATGITEDVVTCETDTAADGVLAAHWRADGTLPEAFLLEIMAQTIGVWAGNERLSAVVPPAEKEADAGLLLSVRGAAFEGTVCKNTGTLVCTMHKLMRDGQLAVFEGEVLQGEKRLAKGRLSVYQPLESELTKLFGREDEKTAAAAG